MAKDYRKRNATRSKGSKSYLWVFVAFVAGYICTSLFDISAINHWIKENLLTKQGEETQIAKKPTQVQGAPKPKFEFYTLLTNEKVPAEVESKQATTPNSDIQATTNNAIARMKEEPIQEVVTASVAQTTSKYPDKPGVEISKKQTIEVPINNKESFLVQVAAFKTKPDAERMKATLLLKGFNVSIATATQNNSNWYRVIIGPFPSRLQAQKAQQAIAQSEHIMGMIKKMDA